MSVPRALDTGGIGIGIGWMHARSALFYSGRLGVIRTDDVGAQVYIGGSARARAALGAPDEPRRMDPLPARGLWTCCVTPSSESANGARVQLSCARPKPCAAATKRGTRVG